MSARLDRKRRVPLYRQCAEVLCRSIQTGRYAVGEFLPSERDLSREMGVNRLTLRKGIGELVLRGLLEKSPCAGNRVVRRRPVAPRSKAIGCLVFQKVGSLPVSPYYAEIYRGIQEEAAEHGFDLFLASISDTDLYTAEGRVKTPPEIISDRFAGVIFTGGLPNELLLAYRARGIEAVLIDKEPPDRAFSGIVPDHYAGARDLARHLLDLGHRRIGFLAAPPDPVVEQRLRGIRETLQEAGLKLRDEDCVAGDYETKFAYPAMKQYLRSASGPLPTVFVAINDEAALGVLMALRESGLGVPQDISVAGFDDIPEAADYEPPLTTVRIRLAEMGRLAARALVRQVRSKRFAPTRVTLRPELIVRGSTARPRPAPPSGGTL